MKFKLFAFFLLYIAIPAIIIPLLCLKFGDWFGLIASACYWLGIILAKFKLNIFVPIPFLFSFWYWYTYGFGVRDYVTVYTFSLLLGYLLFFVYLEIDKYYSKLLPEKEINAEYDAKVRLLDLKIEQYRLEHPGKKVTQELIEQFKTEIFF
jgi:hypothetical protein